MLTRLRVKGFKNLVDLDVRFGPFTCIAGPNGVGKSNLFDAIGFLSALADHTLLEAARMVRAASGNYTDIRDLFSRTGNTRASEMSFEAEMIVPPKGLDDWGQPAEARSTFLRYSLELRYRQGDPPHSSAEGLEILAEELVYIRKSEARRNLLFAHSREWRENVIKSNRKGKEFISTGVEKGVRTIRLHQDGGTRGPGRPATAAGAPRTVLSRASYEFPTALLARNEMRSWRLFQLEPSAIRKPDSFDSSGILEPNGEHLPRTLLQLAWKSPDNPSIASEPATQEAVYQRVANRLRELIDDVYELKVDQDEKRRLYTLQVVANGATFPAQALSDGTLRFLALSVLAEDPETQGVICLEEPENGIHPGRIEPMISLLRDIAMDTEIPAGIDNPLRQVIVNTHSPSIVQQVLEDDLLVAEPREGFANGERVKGMALTSLPGSWRAKAHPDLVCPMGRLLSYLNPVIPKEQNDDSDDKTKQPAKTRRARRVIDRDDVGQILMEKEYPGFLPK